MEDFHTLWCFNELIGLQAVSELAKVYSILRANMCASLSISIKSIVAPGSRSDGFIMLVLPVVMATGNIHNGIIAGKLNGTMPAVTPKH